ncbi:hypothetical protein [Mucilaginibacter aquaedulcis]|nr:hypothetical protein [Mucilaginibacter aquaedulcis]MDN3548644.1 hypothetical protein [Mucilaginibacter aquaedulcis]
MLNYVPVVTHIIKHRDRYSVYVDRYLVSDIENLFNRLTSKAENRIRH